MRQFGQIPPPAGLIEGGAEHMPTDCGKESGKNCVRFHGQGPLRSLRKFTGDAVNGSQALLTYRKAAPFVLSCATGVTHILPKLTPLTRVRPESSLMAKKLLNWQELLNAYCYILIVTIFLRKPRQLPRKRLVYWEKIDLLYYRSS